MTEIQNPARQDYQAFDAWILRVLVWLLGVIARLGAPRRSRLLHRIVRLCERNVEAMVFEMADARIAPLSLRPTHPRAAPPGFRVKRIRGCRFFSHARVRLPAGAGYSDALAEVFYGLPVFQEFQRRFRVWPIPAKPGILHALTDSFKQWQGNTSDTPRIAILDWREVPTFSEFVLFYDYFKAMGVEARIIDPRDCEYRDGKLVAGDFHINLIYKRVLVTELIEALDFVGRKMLAETFAVQHERDRITPERARPVVDRPLQPWDMPVREVYVRRRWR